MNTLRPVQVIGTLVAAAIASAIGSAMLDQQSDWGDPRQAAANILWILFLVTAVASVVSTIRVVARRRRAAR